MELEIGTRLIDSVETTLKDCLRRQSFVLRGFKGANTPVNLGNEDEVDVECAPMFKVRF